MDLFDGREEFLGFPGFFGGAIGDAAFFVNDDGAHCMFRFSSGGDCVDAKEASEPFDDGGITGNERVVIEVQVIGVCVIVECARRIVGGVEGEGEEMDVVNEVVAGEALEFSHAFG